MFAEQPALAWLPYRRLEYCLQDAVQKFCQILVYFRLSTLPVVLVSVEDIRSPHTFTELPLV